jgi:aryl carrier-like protein
MKRRLKELVIISCFFISIGILGTLFNFYLIANNPSMTGAVIKNNENFMDNKNESEVEGITILETYLDKNEVGGIIVYGIIRNNLKENLTYLEVRVKFYDSNKNLLDTEIDSINFINSHENWKFMVNYPRLDFSEIKSYNVEIGQYW